MKHQLPDLPYPSDSLTPFLSAETFSYHYGKHYQAYLTKLNSLIEGTAFDKLTLEEIIRKADGAIFNSAAQVWNHTFYWHSLTPKSSGKPTGKIAEAINTQWGSFDLFKEEFTQKATNLFGSGWTWLVKNSKGKLEIINTSNAATPLTEGHKPLLTLDVWEHAYYIDYRNARNQYIEKFWNFVNWDFANKNFA